MALVFPFPAPLAPNAGRQAPPIAGLGRDKARYVAARFLIPPVENRTCDFHRIRLNTFGRSPWGSHEASVSISMASTEVHPCFIPFRQHTRAQRSCTACAFAGYFVRHLPLYSVLPQARGLRRQSSSWCTWLSHAQTTMPHPTLRQGLGVSLGSPLPTFPLALTSLTKSPVFGVEDSNGMGWVACYWLPLPRSAAPQSASRVGQVDLEGLGMVTQCFGPYSCPASAISGVTG